MNACTVKRFCPFAARSFDSGGVPPALRMTRAPIAPIVLAVLLAGLLAAPSRAQPVVLKPETFKPYVDHFNTMEDEFFIASPVIVGGEILLRGKNHLYCISEKK